MAKDDRDRIREILEGHQKKISVKTVLITALVVIVAGLVVGYYILNMRKPPSDTIAYNMKKLEKMSHNNKIPKTNQSAISDNQTAKAKESQETISKQINTKTGSEIDKNENAKDLNQHQEMPKTYEVKNEIQEAEENKIKEESKNAVGPQIINPYKKSNKTQTVAVKEKNAKQEKNTISKKKRAIAIAKKAKKEIEIAKKTIKEEHKKNQNAIHKANITQKQTKKIVATKDNKKQKTQKSRFVVQVSSYQNKKQAISMVEKLKKLGYNSFAMSVLINNKTYTRVMIGPFDNYFTAKSTAISVKEKAKLKYMPMIRKYDKLP